VGRLFDATDVDAIAAALAWLAGLSAAERAALAERGVARAQEFAPEAMVERTVAVYDRARAGSPG